LAIFPILLFLCFAFCFTSLTQGSNSLEIRRNIQITNPNPIFSLRIELDKREGSSFIPGERMLLSYECSKDAYIAFYQYDWEGRIKIIFPNKLVPKYFIRGGRSYQIENMIPLDSSFGPGYIQGFVTNRPLLARDRFPDILSSRDYPVISFDMPDFNANLRGLLNQLARYNCVSSNIVEFQVVRPYYASEQVDRVMAISDLPGAEIYLDNQYYGIAPFVLKMCRQRNILSNWLCRDTKV